MALDAESRFRGMLGLAMRAGKLIIGTELICRAMPHGNIQLVIASSAASQATRKKLFAKSDYYKITAVSADIDTETLGSLLGKTYAPAAVAVTDAGLAEALKRIAGEAYPSSCEKI